MEEPTRKGARRPGLYVIQVRPGLTQSTGISHRKILVVSLVVECRGVNLTGIIQS